MTRDEILALEGRELDAAVAEYVMGLTVWEGASEADPDFMVHTDDSLDPIRPDAPQMPPLPRYSSDIAVAWQVVGSLVQRKMRFDLTYAPETGDWCVDFGGEEGGRYEVYAETAPTAICRAALLAVMREHDRR